MRLTERQQLLALTRRLAYLQHGKREHDCFQSGPAWSRYEAARKRASSADASAAEAFYITRMRYHVGRLEAAYIKSFGALA
jgi:hypothetical protein